MFQEIVSTTNNLNKPKFLAKMGEFKELLNIWKPRSAGNYENVEMTPHVDEILKIVGVTPEQEKVTDNN